MSKSLGVFEKIALYDLHVTIELDELDDTLYVYRIDKDDYHYVQKIPYDKVKEKPDKLFEILSDIIDNFLEDIDRC